MTPNGREPEKSAVKDGSPPERRPYRAPQLRHLGSVRELALGMTGSFKEGFSGVMKTPM